MKISIENFKSIKSLQNFEIKPFTVLSGVNSSGKSSFIQLLLLLKQTIERNSANEPFVLSGDYYKVREFIDIVYDQNLKNKIEIVFEFNKSEVSIIGPSGMDMYNYLEDYTCKIFLKLDFANDTIIVDNFSVNIILPNDEDKDQLTNFKYDKSSNYNLKTNTDFFGKGISWTEEIQAKVNFLSFYPLYYEIQKDENSEKEFVKIDWVRNLINLFLHNISYIGPNREQPTDEYSFSRNHRNVGIKGQYVAQVLEEFAKRPTKFYRVIEQENGMFYEEDTKTLIEAVKYWMCDVLDVADDIKATKINDTYRITLINKSGLSISIKHVGFGISQLLPIVVEGLKMSDNGTLIVEQPEIHLHPKIQSSLYDFLYGLTKQGKKVIVETHSSHFITRMRRRIAEYESNEMYDNISLTFIENDIFRTIELDDYGTLDYYPDNFIEQSSTELRAIVKAQMNKRLKNK
ncbi:MAG: AAA family ATPase [Desulfobacteraceae bacterium]|nr:AAA family ATPase [Desulfobacteraceae bacterium]